MYIVKIAYISVKNIIKTSRGWCGGMACHIGYLKVTDKQMLLKMILKTY